MASRLLPKKKEKLFIVAIFFLIIVILLYFYFSYVQNILESARLSEKRCFSELTSIKYQLNG